MRQFDFFNGSEVKPRSVINPPEGFTYRPDLITADEERALVQRIRELPFREFQFHGFLGKRRTVSFGWQYDYSGQHLKPAENIPEFLWPLRSEAALFAGFEPPAFQHVLVTEYGPGAGIGWHRDKSVFGQVVGVSLLTSCVLRFRRKEDEKWQRANFTVSPRSAYHLGGPARTEWQHSILRVDELRYAITFRTLRDDRGALPAGQ
jgi:alkylated DNA repair dioxygenase AlkB